MSPSLLSMFKVKVRWSGFIGSPGWSNFYFDGPDGTFLTPADAPLCADRVSTFLTAIKNQFYSDLNWTIQSDVEAISPATGELLNIHNIGPRAAITGGTAKTPYSAASGIVVTWRTNGVRNGRRVRGRTFLVPAATSSYQDDTVLTTALTTFQTAASALATPSANIHLGVWSRPTAPGASDGDWFETVSASVPDKVAILRSRRD